MVAGQLKFTSEGKSFFRRNLRHVGRVVKTALNPVLKPVRNEMVQPEEEENSGNEIVQSEEAEDPGNGMVQFEEAEDDPGNEMVQPEEEEDSGNEIFQSEKAENLGNEMVRFEEAEDPGNEIVQPEEAEDSMSCGWLGKFPEAHSFSQAPEQSVLDIDVKMPMPPGNVNELRPIVHPYTITTNASLTITHGGPRTASTVLALVLNPVISNDQADQPCRFYSSEGLLAKLNALTGYNILLEEPNLESGLALLISHNYDFGIAYAWFRSAFSFIELPPKKLQDLERNFVVHYSGLPNLSDYDGSLNRTKTEHENRDAYYQEPVIQTMHAGLDSEETLTPPFGSAARRLWDLIANRVIPSEWHLRWSRGLDYFQKQSFPKSVPQPVVKRLRNGLALDFAAISHSWVTDFEMKVSPVNGMQWPLPLPVGVTIEAIRNELLSLRGRKSNHRSLIPPRYHYEYCWVDILCLRQSWYDKNGKWVAPNPPESHVQLDHQRLQEWKTDVPTIGGIYREAQQVYVYLNGIGRRYIDDEAVWSRPTHWTKRVWTMQEWVESPSGHQPLVLGTANKGTNVGPGNIQSKLMHSGALPNGGRMIADISSLKEFLAHLDQRSCSNEVDRVGALLYFFTRKVLPVFPVYKTDETIEQAWTRLIGALSNPWKLALSATPGKELTNYIPLLPSWQTLQHTFTGTDIAGLGKEISMKYSPNIQRPLLGPMAIPCTISQISHSPEEGCWLKSAEMKIGNYRNSSLIWVALTFDPIHSSEYYLVPSLCLGTVVAPKHPMDYVRVENGDPFAPFNQITNFWLLRILGTRALYRDILTKLWICLRGWEHIWYRNLSVSDEEDWDEFTIDCWNLLPPRIKLKSQNDDDLEEVNPLSYKQLLELRVRLAQSPWAWHDIFRDVVKVNDRGSEKITNLDCKNFRIFVSRLSRHIKNLDISSECLAGLDKSNYPEFQRFLETLVYLLRGREFDTQEAGDLDDDEISKFRANVLVTYDESEFRPFKQKYSNRLLNLDEGKLRELHDQFLNVRRGFPYSFNDLQREFREEENSFANLFRHLVIDEVIEPYIPSYIPNQELALVVCEKRIFGADPSGEWDGVSYRKVGIARMPVIKDPNDVGLPVIEDTNDVGLYELERYWTAAYRETSVREVFEDLNTLDPAMMMQKYSARSLYSVIYEDRGKRSSNDGPAAMLSSLKDIERITGTLKWSHDREEWKREEREREEREREEREQEKWEQRGWKREEWEQEEWRWEQEERDREETVREETEREQEQSNRA